MYSTDISFLLDTGASVSLLRKDVWDRATIQAPGVSLLSWSGQTLVSVNGSPLTVHGHATVPVCLGTHTFCMSFTVAEDLTTEAILGLDFLKSHHCTIDMGSRSVMFTDGNRLPLSSNPTGASTSPLTVSLVDTLHISAASELEVMAHVTGTIPPQPCLLEQAPQKRLPVMVARALVTPTAQEVPIRVLNPSPETVTLYKGSSIATVEPIDSLSVSPVSLTPPPPPTPAV